MTLKFQELKDKHRQIRDSWTSNNEKNANLRIHRALSWLKASEETDSKDMQFMLLWIAFNALYGQNKTFMEEHKSEKESFKNFFDKLLLLDKDNTLYGIAWNDYSQYYHHIIQNKFVFAPYWDYRNGKLNDEDWKARFEVGKNRLTFNISSIDPEKTTKVLGEIFERLYVLRNQLVHGGATYESDVNRSQIHDGVNILSGLIPAIITLVMDNPNEEWGSPSYPVV